MASIPMVDIDKLPSDWEEQERKAAASRELSSKRDQHGVGMGTDIDLEVAHDDSSLLEDEIAEAVTTTRKVGRRKKKLAGPIETFYRCTTLHYIGANRILLIINICFLIFNVALLGVDTERIGMMWDQMHLQQSNIVAIPSEHIHPSQMAKIVADSCPKCPPPVQCPSDGGDGKSCPVCPDCSANDPAADAAAKREQNANAVAVVSSEDIVAAQKAEEAIIRASNPNAVFHRPLVSNSSIKYMYWMGDLASNEWAPLAIDTCTPDMSPLSAPCRYQDDPALNKHGHRAVELIYPDFELGYPHFPNEKMRRNWLKWSLEYEGPLNGQRRGSRKRYWYNHRAWVRYPPQYHESFRYCGNRGQVLLLKDTKLPASSAMTSWTNMACMNGNMAPRHDTKKYLKEVGNKAARIPAAVYAKGADAWSFQHSMDRASPAFLQGLPFVSHYDMEDGAPQLDVDAPILTSPGQKKIWELYAHNMLDIQDKDITAQLAVFACDGPMKHPYILQRQAELLLLGVDRQLKLGDKATKGKRDTVPLSDRKVVVFFTRSDGTARNGGRNIKTEGELYSKIEKFLKERGQGETLVKKAPAGLSKAEEMRWYNTNVQAIIGAHGGAMYNTIWCAPETMVIEMMANPFQAFMFYEMATVLGHNYWGLKYPALSTKFDFDVDHDDVMSILKNHLGKPSPKPQLRRYYPEPQEYGKSAENEFPAGDNWVGLEDPPPMTEWKP